MTHYGDSLYNIDAAVYNDSCEKQGCYYRSFLYQVLNIKPNPLSAQTFNVNEISDSIMWNEETIIQD